MTGPGHYVVAEQSLGAAELAAGDGDHETAGSLRMEGLVHATLALAAAAARPAQVAYSDNADLFGNAGSTDREWDRVTT